METLFYSFAIIFIIYELVVFFDTKTVLTFVKNLPKKDFSPTQSLFLIFQFFFIVWSLFGLMTSQWYLFLGLFIYTFIPKRGLGLWFYKANALLNAFFFIFLVVNHFNLKIDVWTDFIKPLF